MQKIFIILFLCIPSITFTQTQFEGVSIDYSYNYNQQSLYLSCKNTGRPAMEMMYMLFKGNYSQNFLKLKYKLEFGPLSLKINTSNLKLNYSYQFFLFGADGIFEDEYNNNQRNNSYLPTLLSTGVLIIGELAFRAFDIKEHFKYLMIPAGLINSIHSISLYEYYNKKYHDISIFFRTKLDYYTDREIMFLRYHPVIGLQYTFLIPDKDITYGIKASLGMKFIVDYVNNNFKHLTPRPTFEVSIIFGDLRKIIRNFYDKIN